MSTLPRGHVEAGRYWISEETVAEPATLWRRLVDQFPTSGLWPILVKPDLLQSSGPWTGENWFVPAESTEVAAVNAEDLLQRRWAELRLPKGDSAPVGEDLTFPSLNLAPVLDPRAGGRYLLVLVPVVRPADSVAAIGWFPPNSDLSPAQLTSVLRSWEDRYNWVLYVLEPEAMELTVPPVADESVYAQMIAEQFALAPDYLLGEVTISQLLEAPVDPTAYLAWQ